jgi:FPC/CPF motif-containing protein YcgG
MRRKYEHYQDDIGSAEDFIRLCATRSLMSGKPYTLVDEDGRELATGDWLSRELLEYRSKSAAAGP